MPVQQVQELSSVEAERLIKGAEAKLEELRFLYEQYFAGVERVEPSQLRGEVKKRLMELRGLQLKNTAIKFRIGQITARFNTYEMHWNRVAREVEDGTYSREVNLARYRAQRRHAEDKPGVPTALPSALPAAASPPRASAEHPSAVGVPGLTDDKITAIYKAYVVAKRRCKESLEGLTREKLAASLEKQVPGILKQHKCKTVEFKVVIKNGKAILKAVPKA